MAIHYDIFICEFELFDGRVRIIIQRMIEIARGIVFCVFTRQDLDLAKCHSFTLMHLNDY